MIANSYVGGRHELEKIATGQSTLQECHIAPPCLICANICEGHCGGRGMDPAVR